MSDSESGFSAIELRKFTAAGRTIASAVGTSAELWAYAEMGVVLKTWAGRTKVTTEKTVTRRAILNAYRLARRIAGFGNDRRKGSVAPGQASINLGFRAGNADKVYYRTRKKGLAGGRAGFQDVYGPGFGKGKHIAPADWGAVNRMVSFYRTEVRFMIEAAKKSIGLSRQAVVQIADSLGIRLETVKGGGNLSGAGLAKARRAIPSTGRTYVNGTGVRKTGADAYVEAILRYPLAHKLGMDVTLAQIIQGRLSYFQKNLEEGVFLSAQSAARAYPYLTVLKAAA